MALGKPQAQYRQLAGLLRAAIDAGEFPPGTMLPSEAELAARYETTRDVVNRAVRLLRGWGLVKVSRGRGTVVNPIPVIRSNRVDRYSRDAREQAGAHGAFDSEIRSLGLEPRSETTVERMSAAADVATALHIAEGDPVIRRNRYMYADDTPVQIAPSYIPASIAEGTPLAEVDSGPGGIISRFADLGLAQVRITESVRVRPATDEERAFLELDDDEQVVEIWHVGFTADGTPVELAVHAVPASGWVLEYSWPVS